MSDSALIQWQWGQAGTNAALLSVTLSKPMSVPISVDFTTADGTGKAGSDYITTNGTVSVAPGQTNGTISVPILGDTLDESDESFVVNFTNPVNVQLTDAQARLTILDDDTATFALSDALMETSNTGEGPSILSSVCFRPAPAHGQPASQRPMPRLEPELTISASPTCR